MNPYVGLTSIGVIPQTAGADPHQHSPPDHRADPRQPYLQLQYRSSLRRSLGIRHAEKQQEAFHNANRSLTPWNLVVPMFEQPRAC